MLILLKVVPMHLLVLCLTTVKILLQPEFIEVLLIRRENVSSMRLRMPSRWFMLNIIIHIMA